MRIGLILILLSCLCKASEVVKISPKKVVLAISHKNEGQWKKEERICVVRNGKVIECGEVFKTTSKLALVGLDNPAPQVRIGDSVISEEDKIHLKDRKLATKIFDSIASSDVVKNYKANISIGISAGLSFFFPMIHLQGTIANNFALGLEPIYLRTSADYSSISAIGGILTFNYYGSEYYRGLWLNMGLGGYRFVGSDPSVEEEAFVYGLTGTIGWRGYWDLGLNVGIAIGIQYISDPNFQSISIKALGFQPVAILDVGTSF